MADHSKMFLGKRPRRDDLRTLKLARYLTSSLPLAPASADYTCGITEWGMMLNDQLGCCTIAAVGHAVQTWTANASKHEINFPDVVIRDYYQTWDGYNPADPSTDAGGVELDVLNDWRQQGFAGQTLDAYAAIELDQGPHPVLPMISVMDAIWLFGGAYIGVELPLSAQDQDVWDVPANPGPNDEPGSWGGHAVYLVGYDSGLTELPIADSPLPIVDCRLKELPMDDGRLTIAGEFGIGNRQSTTDNRQGQIVNRQSAIDDYLHHLGPAQEDDLGVVPKILQRGLRTGLQRLDHRQRTFTQRV